MSCLVVYTGGAPFQVSHVFDQDVVLLGGAGSDNSRVAISTDPSFDVQSITGVDIIVLPELIAYFPDSHFQVFSERVLKGQSIFFSAEGGVAVVIYYAAQLN